MPSSWQPHQTVNSARTLTKKKLSQEIRQPVLQTKLILEHTNTFDDLNATSFSRLYLLNDEVQFSVPCPVGELATRLMTG